jgi:hypothetical protein
MDRGYEEICLVARSSSASIRGVKSFRDYVIEHTLEDVMNDAFNNTIPHFIYLGTRSDRRGKYRAICSLDARARIVDYLLNNGSYGICHGTGILAKFTTEGFNNAQM